jgi:Uma2 family endonuclease
VAVRTVVLGTWPPELEAMIERRRALGHDRYDEVWEGEYHVAPAPHPWHGVLDQRVAVVFQASVEAAGLVMSGPCNLGAPGDYRVPDRAVHRAVPATTWVPTAVLVIEVVSPDDESWAKLAFYAARGVEEVVIVDPATRSVRWLALRDDRYEPVEHSAVLGIAIVDLVARIEFP